MTDPRADVATDAEIANIRRRIHINDNDPGDIIAGQALAYACRHILPDILNRLDAAEKENADLRAHSADLPTDLSCAEEINRDAVKFDKASGSRFLAEGTAAVIIGRYRVAHVAPIRARLDEAVGELRRVVGVIRSTHSVINLSTADRIIDKHLATLPTGDAEKGSGNA